MFFVQKTGSCLLKFHILHLEFGDTRQTTSKNDLKSQRPPVSPPPPMSQCRHCNASADSFVFPAAAAAGHAAAVARSEGRVAAHTRRQQRQTDQRCPTQAEALIACVAGARVRVIALRVRHTVVQQAVRAPQEANPPDAGLNGVGCFLAAAPPIVFMVEHVLTVDAARALAVLLTSLAVRLQSSRLHHHHRSVAATELQAAGFAVAPSLHLAAQWIRVGVVRLGRLALGEVYIGVRIVGLGEFVSWGVGVAVVPVAGEPGLLSRVDANDFLLLHLEADMTGEHVHCL